MIGIYIHIPFCTQACHYCNFHFSTSKKNRAEVLEAIRREIDMRATGEQVNTIYLGGGTPSAVDPHQIALILDQIKQSFDISDVQEVTLEANPEDIQTDHLQAWRSMGINRLSIGIQSFFDDDLQAMNRIHNAQDALESIKRSKAAGFSSLNIDLIYGMPWSSSTKFKENLDQAAALEVDHLSCYALTVEEQTALAHQIRTGQQLPVDDQQAWDDFTYLQKWGESNDFDHYEISNLSRPGRHAIHNSHYWTGQSYLGIGPAAHSFAPGVRSWNIANNAKYLQHIKEGELPMEQELLGIQDEYNEWVMTGLRLKKGLEKSKWQHWPANILEEVNPVWKRKIASGIIIEDQDYWRLVPDQRFFADGHARDLFYIE